MPNSFNQGDLVTLSVAFTDAETGNAVDPTEVTFRIKPPSGPLVVMTYTGGNVQKDSVGNYHYDYNVPLNLYGTFYYRFEASGAVQAASETSFFVPKSAILT